MWSSAAPPTRPPAPERLSPGRGAPVEIAMARGVSRATVDYQVAFARQLVDDHPTLLAACLDGQVGQSAAKHIVAGGRAADPGAAPGGRRGARRVGV